jgi:hypothetical protein
MSRFRRYIALLLVSALVLESGPAGAAAQVRSQKSELRNICDFCALTSAFDTQAIPPAARWVLGLSAFSLSAPAILGRTHVPDPRVTANLNVSFTPTFTYPEWFHYEFQAHYIVEALAIWFAVRFILFVVKGLYRLRQHLTSRLGMAPERLGWTLLSQWMTAQWRARRNKNPRLWKPETQRRVAMIAAGEIMGITESPDPSLEIARRLDSRGLPIYRKKGMQTEDALRFPLYWRDVGTLKPEEAHLAAGMVQSHWVIDPQGRTIAKINQRLRATSDRIMAKYAAPGRSSRGPVAKIVVPALLITAAALDALHPLGGHATQLAVAAGPGPSLGGFLIAASLGVLAVAASGHGGRLNPRKMLKEFLEWREAQDEPSQTSPLPVTPFKSLLRTQIIAKLEQNDVSPERVARVLAVCEKLAEGYPLQKAFVAAGIPPAETPWMIEQITLKLNGLTRPLLDARPTRYLTPPISTRSILLIPLALYPKDKRIEWMRNPEWTGRESEAKQLEREILHYLNKLFMRSSSKNTAYLIEIAQGLLSGQTLRQTLDALSVRAAPQREWLKKRWNILRSRGVPIFLSKDRITGQELARQINLTYATVRSRVQSGALKPDHVIYHSADWQEYHFLQSRTSALVEKAQRERRLTRNELKTLIVELQEAHLKYSDYAIIGKMPIKVNPALLWGLRKRKTGTSLENAQAIRVGIAACRADEKTRQTVFIPTKERTALQKRARQVLKPGWSRWALAEISKVPKTMTYRLFNKGSFVERRNAESWSTALDRLEHFNRPLPRLHFVESDIRYLLERLREIPLVPLTAIPMALTIPLTDMYEETVRAGHSRGLLVTAGLSRNISRKVQDSRPISLGSAIDTAEVLLKLLQNPTRLDTDSSRNGLKLAA